MASIILYCDSANKETTTDFSLSLTTVHEKADSMFKNRLVNNIKFIDTDNYEKFAKMKPEMKKA